MTPEEKDWAVREIREDYGFGLREAHDFVTKNGRHWREAASRSYGGPAPQPTVPMPPSDGEQLEAVREAVREYHQALYNLHPNAAAATAAMSRVQDVLGMPWDRFGALRARRETKQSGK